MEKNGPTTVTMTVRLHADLKNTYDKWAERTGLSRNMLVKMAMQYALDNLVIKTDPKNNQNT